MTRTDPQPICCRQDKNWQTDPTEVFDNPCFDLMASVMIGVVLVGAAIALTRETGGLLVGESIDRDQISVLRKIISSEPGVDSVGHLLTMQ